MHGVEKALPGKDKPEHSNNRVGLTKQGETVIGNADDYYTHWRGKLEYVVGGSLRLICNRNIALHRNNSLHPRTAIGIASDGTVILMCADGRTCSSAWRFFAYYDCTLSKPYRQFRLCITKVKGKAHIHERCMGANRRLPCVKGAVTGQRDCVSLLFVFTIPPPHIRSSPPFIQRRLFYWSHYNINRQRKYVLCRNL